MPVGSSSGKHSRDWFPGQEVSWKLVWDRIRNRRKEPYQPAASVIEGQPIFSARAGILGGKLYLNKPLISLSRRWSSAAMLRCHQAR